MKTGAERTARGFTIIEIMVAMSILALIVAAVYSSWMAIVRGSKTGLEAAAAVQRSRIAVQTLDQALTSARSFAADIQYYGFLAENGAGAWLSFVAKLPESFPRSGRFGDYDVRRVTFSLEAGPDSDKQLVLRQNPLLMDMDIDEQEHPIVLAKNVKAFEMLFWDAHSGDWTDEWTQTNQLPQLMAITLRLGGKNNDTRQAEREVIRIISLPSVTVLPGWQAPGPQPPGPHGPT